MCRQRPSVPSASAARPAIAAGGEPLPPAHCPVSQRGRGHRPQGCRTRAGDQRVPQGAGGRGG